MTKKLVKGSWYTVTTTTTCTITDADGRTLGTAEAGKQFSFKATTEEITFSDDAAVVQSENFNFAHVAGANVGFDSEPTSGSGNAVSSGGLYNVLYGGDSLKLGKQGAVAGQTVDLTTGNGYAQAYGVVIGYNAVTTAAASVSIGNGATAGEWAVTVGANAKGQMTKGTVAIGAYATIDGSQNRCIVIGSNSKISKGADFNMSTLLGYNATVKNSGVTCIATWNSKAFTVQTLLYIIAAGSELAEQYEGGEACLGYVVKESSGNVLACGTRKLSELLTSNTAFAPAALDLDAPASQPFLPNGVTEPIELEEV